MQCHCCNDNRRPSGTNIDFEEGLVMSNLTIVVVLAISIVGIFSGVFIIYSVVMRKQWENKWINKISIPLTFGSLFLKSIQVIWLGIIFIIFFGGLIFAVVQENFPQFSQHLITFVKSILTFSR